MDSMGRVMECCGELGYRFETNREENTLILDGGEMLLKVNGDLLIIHQKIFEIPDHLKTNSRFYKTLLMWNGLMAAGAFMLDEDMEYLCYQDTLQIENLDANELSTSVASIEMALEEWGNVLLAFHG